MIDCGYVCSARHLVLLRSIKSSPAVIHEMSAREGEVCMRGRAETVTYSRSCHYATPSLMKMQQALAPAPAVGPIPKQCLATPTATARPPLYQVADPP